jgi:hypothetical protein
MNKKQRVVFIVGGAIAFLMCLVPPYRYASTGRLGTDTFGYAFIFDPSWRIAFDEGFIFDSMYGDAHLDIPRFLIQILAVSILCTGLVFLFKGKS